MCFLHLSPPPPPVLRHFFLWCNWSHFFQHLLTSNNLFFIVCLKYVHWCGLRLSNSENLHQNCSLRQGLEGVPLAHDPHLMMKRWTAGNSPSLNSSKQRDLIQGPQPDSYPPNFYMCENHHFSLSFLYHHYCGVHTHRACFRGLFVRHHSISFKYSLSLEDLFHLLPKVNC